MFLVVGSWAAGVMGIADPINTTAPEAIGQLHSEGLRLMMLTGDSRTPAEVVAHKLDLARGGLPRIEGRGREQTRLAVYVPRASAVLITVLGAPLLARALWDHGH